MAEWPLLKTKPIKLNSQKPMVYMAYFWCSMVKRKLGCTSIRIMLNIITLVNDNAIAKQLVTWISVNCFVFRNILNSNYKSIK